MKKFIFPAAVIVLIIAAIVFLTLSKEDAKTVTTSEGEQVTTGLAKESQKAQEGQPAPDFTLVDFEGKSVKLSDFKGKPVFIDFWTEWCPFCTDEMPEIEKLHKEFGDKVVILGIHRTNTESKKTGEDFARNQAKVTYTLLQDKTDEVYKAYTRTISGMPVAAWIDKNGVVVKLKIGPKTVDEMKSNIQELL